MSTFISTKQESFIERQIINQQPETIKQYTSYTTEPTLLREDYAVKKIERPEAYQFWHKKEKYNSYASRVLNTNYRSCSVINPGQSFQINNVGSGISQSQVDNNNEFQCCTKQQMVVSVVIVSREEIEQPWREECLYLQSVIKELEKEGNQNSKGNRLCKKLEEENRHLQFELQEAQESTLITERVTQNNSEVEVWKRKFQEVNHDYNEAQEKLMNVEIELEALKKEKQEYKQINILGSHCNYNSYKINSKNRHFQYQIGRLNLISIIYQSGYILNILLFQQLLQYLSMLS